MPHIAARLAFAFGTVAVAIAQDPAPAAAGWQRARAVWFVEAQNPVGAELAVGGDRMPWDAAAQKAYAAAKPGDLVPLGRGWPTLDTFTTIDTGAGKLAPGSYVLALERGKKGWQLLAFDGGKVRAAATPANTRPKEKPLATIALQTATAKSDSVRWQVDGDAGHATLTLTLGSAALRGTVAIAGGKSAPVTMVDERGCARTDFGKAGGPAATIDYGRAPWNEEHGNAAAHMQTGHRWRLGTNWWTTLVNETPLQLGGQKLPAGCWHLALEKGSKDDWLLAIADAATDDKATLDAFGVALMASKFTVPMQASKATATASALQIAFEGDGADTRLVIRYGTFELRAKASI